MLGPMCLSHVKFVLLHVLEHIDVHTSILWFKLVTAHVAR